MHPNIMTFDVTDLSVKLTRASVFRDQPFVICLESADLKQINISASNLKKHLSSLGISFKGPSSTKKGRKKFVLTSLSSESPQNILFDVVVHERKFTVTSITKKQSSGLIQFPSSSCVNFHIEIFDD
jgi:ribosomal protein S10